MRNQHALLTEFFPQTAAKVAGTTFELKGASFTWEPLWAPDLEPEFLHQRESVWMKATPAAPFEHENTWDLAHAFADSAYLSDLGLENVISIEPDCPAVGIQLAAENEGERIHPFVPKGGYPRCECTRRIEQDSFWPRGRGFAWHLEDDYTELATARKRVAAEGGGRTIRIGHIDTGYTPEHVTCPRKIRHDLGFNFYRRNTNTSDTNGGIFQGHGTGTLGVLAGARYNSGTGFDDDLGGAPEAEIVPIVATGSVLIMIDQSDWYKAVRHAIAMDCQVISMSAGGLLSGVLAGAIREAYRKGITIVAAAGNYFPWQPGFMRNLTFPGNMPEVIAVTGAMANHRPYQQSSDWSRYSSCFGPVAAMRMAIAAYTPNTARARWNCPNMVDMNGDGTSASTPQVAAAAALWLQMHGHKIPAAHRPRAVAAALFQSADKRYGNQKYLGQGLLRANQALDISPEKIMQSALETRPAQVPTASIQQESFNGMSDLKKKMLLIEAGQCEILEGQPQVSEAKYSLPAPDLSVALYQLKLTNRAEATI